MKEFNTRLIRWHETSGRKDLPWQKRKTPYRVWISEIMLQQTQVSTVIPYFKNFIKDIPDLNSLAKINEKKLSKVSNFKLNFLIVGFLAPWHGLERILFSIGEYNKNKFHDEITIKGIKRNLDGLAKISKERILEELFKMMKLNNFSKIFGLRFFFRTRINK